MECAPILTAVAFSTLVMDKRSSSLFKDFKTRAKEKCCSALTA